MTKLPAASPLLYYYATKTNTHEDKNIFEIPSQSLYQRDLISKNEVGVTKN